jgi:hypothetical protein
MGEGAEWGQEAAFEPSAASSTHPARRTMHPPCSDRCRPVLPLPLPCLHCHLSYHISNWAARSPRSPRGFPSSGPPDAQCTSAPLEEPPLRLPPLRLFANATIPLSRCRRRPCPQFRFISTAKDTARHRTNCGGLCLGVTASPSCLSAIQHLHHTYQWTLAPALHAKMLRKHTILRRRGARNDS